VSDDLVLTLSVIAAVGAGLAGGVFFAFSTFVMQGLDRLQPSDSIRAMQAINVAAPTPPFMTLLFGTAVLAAVLVVAALARWDDAGSGHLLAGGLLYAIPIALTAVYHVPRNNALALVDAEAPGADAAWRHYATGWVRWNHLRTAAPTAACVLYVLAARAI
jgi:uncharacterized membrane protein